ncbi:hypothetical protein GCM10027018_24980 [Paenibacillus thermoaerophilus]
MYKVADIVWYISPRLNVEFGLVSSVNDGKVNISWRTYSAKDVPVHYVFYSKSESEQALEALN